MSFKTCIILLGSFCVSTTALASTTSLSSSTNPAFAGQSITFAATVSGNEPTGTVQFLDGSATIPGCGAVPLSGSGNTKTAVCTTTWPEPGSHTIIVLYVVDPFNGASGDVATQVIAPSVPGTATIVSNPYGTLTVGGATLRGNTISNMSSHVYIQLGNIPGTPEVVAEFDFQGLNLAPGSDLTIRSGAAGQIARLVDSSGNASALGGYVGGNDFGGGGFPVLYLANSNGIVTHPGGGALTQAGIVIDTLGATWTEGGAIVNDGVIEGGVSLEILASSISGGGVLGNGEFRGDRIAFHTFGNAHNPIHGDRYLENFLILQPSLGTTRDVDLTINAYGNTPQIFNLRLVRGSGATLHMPSAWPTGSRFPVNNAVVPPDGVRLPGVPDPGYGGGSMIVRAQGTLKLADDGTGDFVFPGAVVLLSDVAIDFNGVLFNQGWTTSGPPFQGAYFEAPKISSSGGTIRVYGNDRNWINFSTPPATPVRSFSLVRNADGSASYAPSDASAPHSNTYSALANTAASGGCWTCLINPVPVNLYGP